MLKDYMESNAVDTCPDRLREKLNLLRSLTLRWRAWRRSRFEVTKAKGREHALPPDFMR